MQPGFWRLETQTPSYQQSPPGLAPRALLFLDMPPIKVLPALIHTRVRAGAMSDCFCDRPACCCQRQHRDRPA